MSNSSSSSKNEEREISPEEQLAIEIAASFGSKMNHNMEDEGKNDNNNNNNNNNNVQIDEGKRNGNDIITKPIAMNFLAQAKRLLLFQNLSKSDIERWENESFNFSNTLTFGLNQSQGGPCGVFAAVQAFIIETLLFDKEQSRKNKTPFIDKKVAPLTSILTDENEIQHISQHVLSIALAKILYQTRRGDNNDNNNNNNNNNSSSIIVVTLKKNEDTDEGKKSSSSSSSLLSEYDENNLLINTNFKTIDEISACIFENITDYQKKGGILLFLYSIIASRGVQTIKDDMDDPTQRLTLEHGHCSQELLNLLICGYATSQVHDGNIPMGDTGLSLNGVQNTPRIGYLTYLEALRYCTVGEFYKTPGVPIWVVGSDSHFTVLFATNSKVGQDSPQEKHSKLLKRVFNKFDESGGGFVQTLQLQQILQELNLLQGNSDDKIQASIDVLTKELDIMGNGIILWNDMENKLVNLMVEGVDIVERYSSMSNANNNNSNSNNNSGGGATMATTTGEWACPICTFINETSLITVCSMCGTAKPAPSPQQSMVTNNSTVDLTTNDSTAVTEPDLKRMKPNNDDDGSTFSSSSSKTNDNDNEEDEDISDFNGFSLFHYNGLTGLVKGVERGVVLTKCTVYKRVDIVGLNSGSSSGGMGKNRIDEVIRTKFKNCEIEWDGGNVGNING